jgi:hypothetical protein
VLPLLLPVCTGFDLGQSQECSYFRGGEAGYHKQWDSRILNYGHWEVQRYLLSNLRYWLDEFQFDGFRWGPGASGGGGDQTHGGRLRASQLFEVANSCAQPTAKECSCV